MPQILPLHRCSSSLKDNVVFSDESIVDAIFEPSKVDAVTVMDIIAEIKDGRLAETKKYYQHGVCDQVPLPSFTFTDPSIPRSCFLNTSLTTDTTSGAQPRTLHKSHLAGHPLSGYPRGSMNPPCWT